MFDPAQSWHSLTPIGSAQVFRHVYEQFSLRVADDPTIDAVLDVAESLTGLPVVLTDGDGQILRSSRPIGEDPGLAPPPIADLVAGPVRSGEWLCATAMTLAGSNIAWMLVGTGDETDGPADEQRLEVLLTVLLVAEYASILDRYSVSPIPEVWRQRTRLVRLTVEAGSPERIRAIADEIGHDLHRAHHAVVLESTLGIDAPRFATMVGPRLQDFGLIAPIGGRVVVVVGDARHLHPLVEVLRNSTDLGPFRVGVSAAASDGIDLSRAFSQAVAATEERSMEHGVVVSWYDEHDPVALMVRLADEETIRRYIDSALGPLLHYEGPHREEFLETLRVWIDSTDSLDAVAQQLHIHRSTLVYRIRRIKEVLGHDIRDPEDRFGISVAFRMLDRVGGPGGSGT